MATTSKTPDPNTTETPQDTTDTTSVDLANEKANAADISEAQQHEQGESYDPNSDPVMVSTAVSEHVVTDLVADGTSPTLDEYRNQAKQSDTNEPSTA